MAFLKVCAPFFNVLAKYFPVEGVDIRKKSERDYIIIVFKYLLHLTALNNFAV